MHISSSNAKILGETNFHTREFPRSRSKAKNGGEEEEQEKVGNNNGQLRIATPPREVHASRLGQNCIYFLSLARELNRTYIILSNLLSCYLYTEITKQNTPF